MEAAGISADQALKPRTSEVISEFISKYGLIALLIAFPAYYGIQDLINDGNLTRIDVQFSEPRARTRRLESALSALPLRGIHTP